MLDIGTVLPGWRCRVTLDCVVDSSLGARGGRSLKEGVLGGLKEGVSGNLNEEVSGSLNEEVSGREYPGGGLKERVVTMESQGGGLNESGGSEAMSVPM